MKRYQKFGEMVQAAAQYTPVWVNTEGRAVTVLELSDSIPQNADLSAPAAYVVSEEGAIGVTRQFEYETTWIMVPMKDGPEKEEAIRRIQEALNAAQAPAPEPEPQPEPEIVLRLDPGPVTNYKKQEPEEFKYCIYCGAKIEKSAKFCIMCGRSQEY